MKILRNAARVHTHGGGLKSKPVVHRREMLALAAAPPRRRRGRGLRAQGVPASRRIRIVDAQVHIWSGGKPTPAQRQQPVSQDQLWQEMTEAGVERAVIVPTSWDPLGNQPALEAAKAHPDRFAVMGLLNIADPQSRALVDTWKQQPGMLGVRLFLGTPQAAAWLTERHRGLVLAGS